MPEGTEGAPRPQTGTARRNSKSEHRAREREALLAERIEEAAKADSRPLLSVEGAARYLDCSRWTVYRLIEAGELQAVTVGKRIKVRPADIDRYLAAS